MTEVLDALILSGHMTREHDNEHRSFRAHNQWITTLLEDTGRFRVRVIEDPRGTGAEVIDRYDVVIVVFEGRDGFFDKGVGFGPVTDAALLKFVHDDGKGIVWFHGSAAQEPDWGYPEEYNVMRGSTMTVATGSAAPAVGRGAVAHRGAAASHHRGCQRDVDGHRRRHPDWGAGRRQCAGAAHGVRRPRGVRAGADVADVALPGRDPFWGDRGPARYEQPTSRSRGSTSTAPAARSPSRSATTSTRSGASSSSACSRAGSNGRRPARCRSAVRIGAGSAASSPGRTTTARVRPAQPEATLSASAFLASSRCADVMTEGSSSSQA